MMKDIKKALVVAMLIAVGFAMFLNLDNTPKSENHIYEITGTVNNDEFLKGVALNNVDDNNKGIFLVYNENIKNKGIEVGDKIEIVWGENNVIESVEKIDWFTKTKNNDIVGRGLKHPLQITKPKGEMWDD